MGQGAGVSLSFPAGVADQGLFTLPRWVALLVKIDADKAEAEGFGGSNVETDNAVWPDFHRSPRDEANFPHLFVHRR
jgi:hypothetical protein